MLEGLIAWVLNNYLGKYVENLNTDQLSIALLSGEVELENLPLKKDALRHLGLPIEIKAGFIGKVKLQIPVRQIKSAPWVILIEQLYLVASPLPVEEWDVVTEELAAQELKLSALDNLEARWRLETDKDSGSTYYASTYSSWLSYGTGLITNIIENLQLKIRDVHIRYEDHVSIPSKAVAFGFTVESLSAQSCDQNWVPGFSHWNSSVSSFKILEMQKLAVYWTALHFNDSFTKLNLGDLALAMSPNQSNRYSQYYILAPVSAQAHLKRNRSEKPLRSPDSPRIVCDLQLEEVPMTLIDWQYEQMVKCTRGLDEIARLRSYRQYRPACSIKEDARAWWLYAISCFYPGSQPAICRPRPTWESCLERAKQNVQYVRIYIKILMTPSIAINSNEKKIKDLVEWNRTFDELKVLRELAMKSVPIQNRGTNNNGSTGRGLLVRWFPQWMGWYSSSSAEQTVTNSETTQLEGEILQVLTDSVENNTLLKRDAVFGQFSFILQQGSLTLCTVHESSENSLPMLELQFKNLCLNVTSRPRTSSHLMELSLGSLHLKDKCTPDTLFPVLIGPPGQERVSVTRPKGSNQRISAISTPENLFYLEYEKCPQNSGCDYRLCVKTKSLDVVYQPAAVRWLVEFLCLPHQRVLTHSNIEAMKTRTKKELIKNWEQILDGRTARKIWELQLDITAPQILFIEKFNDQNSAMAVIDFGRLQLTNKIYTDKSDTVLPDVVVKEMEEDEMFVTPCSTPPVSEESDLDQQPLTFNTNLTENSLNEMNLHNKLYDHYNVELTEMQILIGKVKDNWRYAHSKGTSTLHVLDRFNISMHIERRIIPTTDPLYPSLTFNANLPRLVAHINESKICAARTLTQIIRATGLPSPFNISETSVENGNAELQDDDDLSSVDASTELSRQLMLQFTIDHMALDVQSRGRSVAELQVAGVKVAFTKRPIDINIMLTVHSLLLVDALQTFGPDFELLVASHKHVGMDSVSGSIRDSEPTSPTSPGSPDPNITRASATSPMALTHALTSLTVSPPSQSWLRNYNKGATILDAEALISIDVVLVTGAEPIQIANIQFNNLDIIANQETIVELMGFMRRVFPEIKSQKPTLNLPAQIPSSSIYNSSESVLQDAPPKMGTTELTFDFHRLNILLLRGIVKEGCVVGKKICTATMTEAKIQATVESNVIIEGSLGGLQVLDLTSEGNLHQRIISVGRDPFLDVPHPLYVMSQSYTEERKAFSFKITRSLNVSEAVDGDRAEIVVRMASLWYTHSPQFLLELQSCATEFKQYLSHLARTIRSAATDMALGLVHARAEALAQSIYMNSRLSASIYGSALSFSDIASPRRKRRTSSTDYNYSGYSSARDTVPQTPYSPADDNDILIDIKLDIVLDSPVIILPRCSNSTQVFVGHLGKITINNSKPSDSKNDDMQDIRSEHYDIEIKDMNIFSLDISTRRAPGPSLSRLEDVYSCNSLAKPILHDTILQLNIDREVPRAMSSRQQSFSNLLLDDNDDKMNQADNFKVTENIQISGSVVTALKVSMIKSQYEQLLDTLKWLTESSSVTELHTATGLANKPSTSLSDIREEDTGVTTLKMDPHVRAKLFPSVTVPKQPSKTERFLSFKVLFELPSFIIELKGDTPTGEQALVDLCFRDFVFIYEKSHLYETNIQVSLRSILMEDLLQAEGSKQRAMVVSSAGEELPSGSTCVSRSCPDIFNRLYVLNPCRGSLPTDLELSKILGISRPSKVTLNNSKDKVEYPCTPPPSPSLRSRPEKNLVLVSTLLVDPSAPNFSTFYKSIQRSTSVDFNCLDLVISVESWVVFIDFFSASPSNVKRSKKTVLEAQSSQDLDKETGAKSLETAETNISVRSLTMILVRSDRDIARANISHLDVSVKTTGLRKEVEGQLGSMSLLDLTLHGQLYRERFLTSGKQALNFLYIRHAPHEVRECDSYLKLEMSSVLYVHTKRFVAEIRAFFNHFTRLQAVMAGIRAATSGQKIRNSSLRLSLIVEAASPVILLPVNSKSSNLLICDLGQLSINNCFKFTNDPDTISVVSDSATDRKCLLDVMFVELQNVSLCAGEREMDCSSLKEKRSPTTNTFKLGSCMVRKKGPSLLTDECHLKLQIERNLDCDDCHNVPDVSIHGELSKLDATLDESQYKLIRGLLTHNLGEDTEHILPSVQSESVMAETTVRELWTLNSIRLDLLNVTVRFENSGPLGCINFVKSRLTIESFSNLSQDIDLESQEILIRDTRFDDAPSDKRCNVFTHILQPLKTMHQSNVVQVEIHSRKRQDQNRSTILLNNMRLMAVFDWWEAAFAFVFQNIDEMPQSPSHSSRVTTSEWKSEGDHFEFKLNITESEVVLVEDTSQWDTNAVILKSTTVISYRPEIIEKPLSCNLNNCEMYSCILGMEDETALSIIDPVTLNMDINKDHTLEVHLQNLTVKVSYYDMRMFLQILNSLPKQMFARKEEIRLSPVTADTSKLMALGFTAEDCVNALDKCEQRLDDAALWLTEHAVQSSSHNQKVQHKSDLMVNAVEVTADLISLCIIDDCGDADVPLLEVSLSKLNLRQPLSLLLDCSETENLRQGALECSFSSDYYNRVLSGWEPIVEPWRCSVVWRHFSTMNLQKYRLYVGIESKEKLNVNVTSTLTELYKMVKDNWTQDFYNTKDASQNSARNSLSPSGYRHRSPFVPYAIKNVTGSTLQFSTLISELREIYHHDGYKRADYKWSTVGDRETVAFSFKSRDKRRHSDTHKMRMHRLGMQVEGYQEVTPVTVDKVGVFFRNASPSIQRRTQQDVPPARIVFDISLEGSSRKLITVRSALLIVNKLSEGIEVKLEDQKFNLGTSRLSTVNYFISSGDTLAIPLVYSHASINVRPVNINQIYTFPATTILWDRATKPNDVIYESKKCHTNRGSIYRFCAEIKRENYPVDRNAYVTAITGQQIPQPGHTITLLPTVLLVNLLPVDLTYILAGISGRMSGGSQTATTFADTDSLLELRLHLDNFPHCVPIEIPAGGLGTTYRMKLADNKKRRLNLIVTITPHSEAKLKITVSVSYWIINKTGLPLVFRQGGVTTESAGQFQEHETARMVAPLLFSLSDPDGSPTIVGRVGTNVIRDGTPQWCSNFHLQRGIQVRKLKVSFRDSRPDCVFIVGIEIRTGRGKYRDTNIIIISPRFQLHNKTSYQLLFAQSCDTVNTSEISKPSKTPMKAMPDCHMPFHWGRFDQDQLLCVLIEDVPGCWWSGGLRIDENYSMHVNIRDANSRMYFLRLEVVLQGATFFVVFTDADAMPPPMRVDNFSEVSMKFAQNCCKFIVHSTARAHSSVPYAWDKPNGELLLSVEAPGGVTQVYDMNKLGPASGLTYENFIYIALTETFKNRNGVVDPLDVESQELVLDVVNKTHVVLARKRHGQRSQLWRMTTTGQLHHEGSSPPSHPQQPKSDIVYVLDIEGTAPQPSTYSRLCLRRPDPRRKSTQTWRFTEDGRLCCVHHNMYVQAQDGFYGMRPGSPVACWQQWNAAVLGMPQRVSHRTTPSGIPLEQAISRQRLRPGSGFLDVEVTTDGPTRVLNIWDKKEKRKYAVLDDKDWTMIVPKQRPQLHYDDDESETKRKKEVQLTLRLKGVGISLILRKPAQEILFAKFANIVGEILLTSEHKRFCISVGDIQIDNQLFETPVPVLLFVTPLNSRDYNEAQHKLPAIEIMAEMQPVVNVNAVIFKHFIVNLKKLTVHLEERLLLKIFAFIGFTSKEEELCNVNETDYETQRMLTDVSAAHAKRYYFGIIQLMPNQIRLSMKTANKLSSELQLIKKKLGLTLIKFEDAAVDLEPFVRKHLFETSQFLLHSVIQHFKTELKWQAAIYGSVDFLGNPLGFVNDVSEGVNGLIREGNVGALVTNIAHGLSNSAAKVTETISDGLGLVTFDEEHEEIRQKIRTVESGRGRDHLYAGIKGLGFGILGGATGIFKQVYEGAANEGIQGAFSGIGKGLLGAVAKPVVGVLDLASETARAVRDSSKSSSRKIPERVRPPRCVFGPGGLLPHYSYKQALGQQYLYSVNDRNYSEHLVAYENLRSGSDDLRVIISNQGVRIVTNANGPGLTTVLECHLNDLQICKPVTDKQASESRHYIEITMHVTTTSAALVYQDPIKKPKIRCDSGDLARSVSQQINYAKCLFDERRQTLNSDNIIHSED